MRRGSRPRRQVTATAEPEPAAIAGPALCRLGGRLGRLGARAGGAGVAGASTRAAPRSAGRAGGAAGGARTLEPAGGAVPRSPASKHVNRAWRAYGSRAAPDAVASASTGLGRAPLAPRLGCSRCWLRPRLEREERGPSGRQEGRPRPAPEECRGRPVRGGGAGGGRRRGGRAGRGPSGKVGGPMGTGSTSLFNAWPASPSGRQGLLLTLLLVMPGRTAPVFQCAFFFLFL